MRTRFGSPLSAGRGTVAKETPPTPQPEPSSRVVRHVPGMDRKVLDALEDALRHCLLLLQGSHAPDGDASPSSIIALLGKAEKASDFAGMATQVRSLRARQDSSVSGLRELALRVETAAKRANLVALATDIKVFGEKLSSLGPTQEVVALAARSIEEVIDYCARTRDGAHLLRDALSEVVRLMTSATDSQCHHRERLESLRDEIASATSVDDLVSLRDEIVSATSLLVDEVSVHVFKLEEMQRRSLSAERSAQALLAELTDERCRARTDPLTQLGNRRALSEASRLYAGSPSSTGVMALDIDHFKKINDTYGHTAGDEVLIVVSDLMRAELRTDDAAFRVGGEEFCVLLASCDRAGALRTADRIRQRVERHVVNSTAGSVRVTVSVGVAVWTAGTQFVDIHKAADAALYSAKAAGRNRVELASSSS